MVTAVAYPANLTWLGIAKEVTYGTAVAAPTIWIPLESPSWKPDARQLRNEALYGDMTKLHGVVKGVRNDTISYTSPLLLDSLFQHMGGILGAADTVTGAADPWTHTTAVLNSGTGQPPSYTLFLYNGAEAWQMAGAILSKVEVTLKSEDLGKLAAEWVGMPATQIVTPTNTPSTAVPWPSWNSTITVNAVVASTYSDVKLSYTREVKPIFGVNGQNSPVRIFGGPVGAEIDVTGVYQGYAGTPSDLSNLLTNGHVPFLVKVNPEGDTVHYAQWQHTTCAVMSSEVKDSAGSYVEIQAKYAPIGNTTDATVASGGGTSPVKFTLLNAAGTPL